MSDEFANDDSEEVQAAKAYFFEGLTRDEVARKFGMAEGKVSAIIEEYRRRTEKGSLKEIQTFVRAARKAGQSVNSLVPGARIISMASKLGLTLDGVESLLEALGSRLKGKVNQDELVKALASIMELSKDSEIPLEDLAARLHRDSETYKALKSRISQANEEAIAAERRARDAIEDSNLKAEAVRQYQVIRTNLAKIGFDWSDMSKLHTILLNFQDCQFSQMGIVERLTKAKTLRSQIEALTEELAAEREELKLLGIQVEYAKRTLEMIDNSRKAFTNQLQELLNFAAGFKEEMNATATNMRVSSHSLQQDCISIRATLEVLIARRSELEKEYQEKNRRLDIKIADFDQFQPFIEWALYKRPIDSEVALLFSAIFDKWVQDNAKRTGQKGQNPLIQNYGMYLEYEVKQICGNASGARR